MDILNLEDHLRDMVNSIVCVSKKSYIAVGFEAFVTELWKISPWSLLLSLLSLKTTLLPTWP